MNQTPLTFTPGKFYRTRGGLDAFLFEVGAKLFGKVRSENGNWTSLDWNSEGRYSHFSDHELDLTGDWRDSLVEKPEGSK